MGLRYGFLADLANRQENFQKNSAHSDSLLVQVFWPPSQPFYEISDNAPVVKNNCEEINGPPVLVYYRFKG